MGTGSSSTTPSALVVPGGAFHRTARGDFLPAELRPSPFLCWVLFRRLFLNYLEQAFDSGELQFFSSPEPLRTRHAFLTPHPLPQKINWKVYAKPPFGGPEQVLRTSHGTPIGWLSRTTGCSGWTTGRFSFAEDYRDNSRHKTMTLAPRSSSVILLHVLPEGFQRIRYYGFLAIDTGQRSLHCAAASANPPPAPT